MYLVNPPFKQMSVNQESSTLAETKNNITKKCSSLVCPFQKKWRHQDAPSYDKEDDDGECMSSESLVAELKEMITNKMFSKPLSESFNLSFRLNNIDRFIGRKLRFSNWKKNQSFPLDEKFKVFFSGNYRDTEEVGNFHTILSKNNNLKYLSSGNYGHVFRLDYTLQDEKIPLVVKLMAYKAFEPPEKDVNAYDYRNLSVDHPGRAENVEIEMAALLRDRIVISGISPHVSLPTMAIKLSWDHPSVKWLCSQITDSEKLQESEEQYNKVYDPNKINFTSRCYKKDYIYELKAWAKHQKGKTSVSLQQAIRLAEMTNERNNPDHKCLVYISEYSMYQDLLKWSKTSKTELEWSVFMFQLLFTIAGIQAELPSWRHNDFSPRNLLIQKTTLPDDKRNHKYLYQLGNKFYLLPNVGFSIRLWDFDFSSCDELPNHKVHSRILDTQPENSDCVDWFDDFGILKQPCSQYDLHHFFNYLAVYMKSHWSLIPDTVKSVMKSWIPPPLRGATKKGNVYQARLTIRAQNNLTRFHTSYKDLTEKINYVDLSARLQLEKEPLFSDFRVSIDEIQEVPGLLGYFHSPGL